MYKLNSLLNRITMYRLTLYILISYLFIATLLGVFEILPFSPINIILQSAYLSLICFLTNKLFAKFFNATTNTESSLITALILALIVGPTNFLTSIFFLTFVGVVAMASKYILAINKRHIFNPAAIAVVISVLTIQQGASWWVGSRPMLLPLLVGGALILAKIKKFSLAFSFIIPYLLYFAYLGAGPADIFLQAVTYYFASVMLIEPLTSPDSRRLQVVYGALVAVLFVAYQRIFGIAYTLELALVSGNLFSYVATRPFRVFLELVKKKKIAKRIFAFHFEPEKSFGFTPGQFMHWTLPHKNSDSRGIRRYFTIASSPTEENIMIAVKIPEKHSSFKEALKNIKEGGTIEAMDVSGEFTLPEDTNIPLCFIAGGIGVTPFRSMAKWLLDKNQKRDIVLLYSSSTEDEIAFKNLFKKTEKIGLKANYITTEKDGYIDEEMIKEKVADYKDRIFYISGPQPMVDIFKNMLSKMKVKDIKSDFFPGYTEKHQE